MEYRIFEGNMERLEKKLQKIENKCKKYGNTFTYERISEEFAEYTDENGNTYTVKYIVINVEGKAIINDWKFIARVQHTEQGNIITKCCDIEVPERYYTSDSVCEHCNAHRYRKDTYIVQNTTSGEFKQVGKSCLTDFTNGMSAEGIACYVSLFDEIIEGKSISHGYHTTHYIKTIEAMQYIAETIRCFGYVKSDGDIPTKIRAKNYYNICHGIFDGMPTKVITTLKNEMEDVSFNPNSAYARELVQDVLIWINNQEESNNYFHNLKTICKLEYITYENFGLLASVFPSYNRDLEKVKEQVQERKSEFVGNIGDRITVKIANFVIVTSWETQYGTTVIYKITDTVGNIYTWKQAELFAER